MRYDQEWHHYFASMTSQSAHKIMGYLCTHFNIQSAIEFGCGHAHWLEVATQLGIADIQGLDGPWTELDQLRIDQKNFRVTDLEASVNLSRQFDLAICMEVGEHLHENAASILVRSISSHSDLVLFGAAIPLQGGFKHINERWQSYWADLFIAEGYRPFDLVRPVFWNDTELHYYYSQNTLVYIRENAFELIKKAELAQIRSHSNPILDVVHPEKYMDYAGYESIALKRMLPRLPRALWKVIRRRIPL